MDEAPNAYLPPNTGPAPVYAEIGPVYTYQMRVRMGRVRGRVSEYRDGVVHLDGAGLVIDGRAVLPEPVRTLVALSGIVLGCLGVLITATIAEYAIRSQRRSVEPWISVDEIVANANQQRVCIVYREQLAPSRPSSLAFGFDPGVYIHFMQAAQHLAPGKLREGKIGSPNNTVAVVVLLAIILGVAIFLIYAALHSPR